ncbi:MAG: xanthine dehydrogenase family protein molybdopterin-binding subunit [Pseudomonadales bacterium]|nr:xanthine dehydrogenase family protein molybdopterin-binding subunit [Pseudomonadales bacterium]
MGKWTRRGFITAGVIGGAALVIGVGVRPGNRNGKVASVVTDEGEHLINIWVKIDENNKVTAIVPHSEMGQGAQTALTQMLADEMDVAWNDVSFIEAPPEDEYANYKLGKGYLLGPAEIPGPLVGSVDGVLLTVAKAMHLQITGGSLSIRTTGVYGMRVAGAAAREMLVQAAASDWGVAPDTIKTVNGMLIHEASGKQATYASFAAAAGQLEPPYSPTLKTPDQFNIMGKSVARRDIPAKVDGTAMFGIDVTVPGMKYAAIKAAPVFGATLGAVDDSAARNMPGVHSVVRLDDAVAVVADGYWQASQALKALKIDWQTSGNEIASSETIFAQFRKDMDEAAASGNTKTDVETGNTSHAFADASRVVEVEYTVPYLAHACMEPMNAVANHTGKACEIWTGSQNPLGFRHEIAAALDLDSAAVTMNNYTMGGGFGRRATPDTAIQAARISQAAGVPVKLIWSREEDVQHDIYRPAVASRFRAALDDYGLPEAWENLYVDKHEPVEAPHIPYAIANQKIHFIDSPTHVPFGPWRSVDHSQHGFFTESFIDELAWENNQDPFEYRRQLLSNHPRHRKVLELVAEKANWGEPLGANRGRGIALQESFGTIVGEVVEVTVENNDIRVDRVVVAVDAGYAVSPDGLTAQMESGVIYGLTAALYGEISIDNGAVKQTNFDSYPMVRMDKAPKIETHIINSLEPWGGAGEPGVPGTAPALANAIYAATGTRVRHLPISKYEFNVRMEESEEVAS